MTLETWRPDALKHALWLLEKAGHEYALHAADEAEKASDGVLKGLGKKLRQVIEDKRKERK